MALTFDDGPTPIETEQVLDILQNAEVTATFFLVGKDIANHLESARLLVKAGHEIGNHSLTHRRMIFKTRAVLRHEIQQTDQLIREAGYLRPTVFRPPYCKKLIGLPLVLVELGKTTATWDVEPDSSQKLRLDPKSIARCALERVRPGSVILLHVMGSGRKPTIAALPLIIAGLRARGYEFRRISELVEIGAAD